MLLSPAARTIPNETNETGENMTTETETVILPIHNHQGYAADQIHSSMTLADLADMVDLAIERYGKDAIVVTKESGNRYGARWGSIDSFSEIAAEDDDE